MKPITYFCDCHQTRALAMTFGDGLSRLSNNDQAALVVVLAGYVYGLLQGQSMTVWFGDEDDDASSAVEHFLPNEFDSTGVSFENACQILEGIDTRQALDIIHFLTQG